MFMSQLLSEMVQFHADVFVNAVCFYFAIKHKVKKERETHSNRSTEKEGERERIYMACPFFISLEEHRKKKQDRIFSPQGNISDNK
jgi:hypothetical protein